MEQNRYEFAFERYLRAIGRPFISNRQERRFALNDGTTLKNFDCLVTSRGGINWIVDVKGRRFPGGTTSPKYWKNWITEDDLTGLIRWEGILSGDGSQYLDRSLFVFAYHVLGSQSPIASERLFRYRDAYYAFLAVPLSLYLEEAKFISPKWHTYEVPTRRFQQIATPVDEFFKYDGQLVF